MKIENSLVIIGGIQLILISVVEWTEKSSSIDIHLHDTYYVIHVAYVQLFCLSTTIIDFVIYKLIRTRIGKVNTGLSLLQIGITVTFYLLVAAIWKEQQNGIFQDFKILLAFMLFIISQVLLIIHFFLRTRKRKSHSLHS